MSRQPSPPDFDPLFTVQEVAKRFSVSVATVWRLSKSGDIPQPVRIGRSVRWRASDLNDHLDAQQ